MTNVDIYLNDELDKYLRKDVKLFQFENMATTFVFHLPDQLQGLYHEIHARINTNEVVSSELPDIDNTVSFVLTDSYTHSSGFLYIQLHSYDMEGMVSKSKIYVFEIKPSLMVEVI